MDKQQIGDTLGALGRTIDALVRAVAVSQPLAERYVWLRDTATKEQIEEFANSLRKHRNSFIDAERKSKP